MLYNGYIRVDRDFVPVFTQESDAGERWKSFIPHESIRGLILNIIAALSGEKQADRKAFWMTGSYGTGKTYAAFLIKHLLEDDVNSVKEWFDNYPQVSALWPEFDSLRSRKKMLVPIFHSASSMVKSDARLFMEIQNSILKELKAKGYTNSGANSLGDLIAGMILDSTSSFNFDGAFRRHIDEFEIGETPEGIRQQLRAHPDNQELLMKLFAVLEAEGVYLIRSVEDMKAWITDVIKRNGIDTILFLWDEFTDYFKNNSTTSSLQELAHLSAEGRFFLYLITHRDLAQFSSVDMEAQKVLRQRFYIHNLQMTDVTSYQLLGNAIKPLNDKKNEWFSRRLSLWESVQQAYNNLAEDMPGSPIDKTHFLNLVPMHPYTALLLSTMSSNFSASQRTMFSFLQSEQSGVKQENFHWFINHVDLDKWPWLTADYLWNYFFAEENTDLDGATMERINYYLNQCKSLNDEEIRVFRVIMLFLIMEARAKGNRAYRASIRNVVTAFIGTPLQGSKVRAILSKFIRDSLINKTGDSDDANISLPMISVDPEKMKLVKQRVEQESSFERCLAPGNTITTCMEELYRSTSQNRFAMRFYIRMCSASRGNANSALMDIRNNVENKPYTIGALLMFAKTDEDVKKIQGIILEETNRDENARIVFVNMAEPIREEQWDLYIDHLARSQYSREVGSNNAQYYMQLAQSILTNWRKKLQIALKRAFFQGDETTISEVSLSGYYDRIAKRVYSWGMENLAVNDNLYKQAYADAAIRVGMGLSSTVKDFNPFIEELKRAGMWESKELLKQAKLHPLNKAYAQISSMIEANRPHPTRIQDIWNVMQAAPYGYLPNLFAAFLMGYLLESYTREQYYLNDGKNTLSLSPDGLANALLIVMKGKNNASDYQIMQMKSEHISLCKRFQQLFGLTEGQVTSLQEAKKYIRLWVSDARYPLWVAEFSPYFEQQEKRTELREVLKTLSDFLTSDTAFTSSREFDLADKLYELIYENKLGQPLRGLLTKENLLDGMDRFLKKTVPSTLAYHQSIGHTIKEVRELVRDRTSESGSWLWNREKFSDELKRMEQETELIEALNRIFHSPADSLAEAQATLKSVFCSYRLPRSLVEKAIMVDTDVIERLRGYVVEGRMEDLSALASAIRAQSETISRILYGEAELSAKYIATEFNMELPVETVRTEILDKLSPGSWLKSLSSVHSRLESIIQGMQALKEYEKLCELWRQISCSTSPAEWSGQAMLPIAWMPVYLNDDFSRMVYLLNAKRPGELTAEGLAKIRERIKKQATTWAASLADPNTRALAFMEHTFGAYKHMCGKYITVEGLRSMLVEQFGSNVYAWSARQHEISEFTRIQIERAYNVKAVLDVKLYVDKMSPERAKSYLKEQLEKNPMMGIAILKEYQGV